MPTTPKAPTTPPVNTSLLPTAGVMLRLLALYDHEGKDIVGTASLIQQEGKEYIVTAHHVFQKANWSGNLLIAHHQRPSLLSTRVVGHDVRKDITVVASTFSSVKRWLEPTDSDIGVATGQDVLCLGYAHGLHNRDDEDTTGYPLPLTTRATLAFADSANHLFLVDRHSAGGMSGGLVVYREIDTFQWQVLGIIVSALCQERTVQGERVLWPSGFTQVAGIKAIRPIIDSNPVGCPIDPLIDTASNREEQSDEVL